MNEYEIYVNGIRDPIYFIGRYRRDLESENWHYYERKDGVILHFHKPHMVLVIGDTYENVKKSKESMKI